ncbi:Astacin (Peptidase M12A) [Parelaphostrongylus tenuis]|uniref:Astacin (Peptidase M12A) n=1 Tax=Parelaphostrongylus tenuis TaxID=148309 RepID=A0AAD5MW13_PARTN|nr:Astacin (Peptidase M12A) [Parelaphostrongylus tenuis]
MDGHPDVSAAEINGEKHVGLGMFQGDIMLTREQAYEILEDMKVSLGRRKKRHAYRDNNYPATLWSNGINYAFWNAYRTAFTRTRPHHRSLSHAVQTRSRQLHHTSLRELSCKSLLNQHHTVAIEKMQFQYDWHDQFNKESESTNYNYNITYDYGTVMHYPGASPG